MNEKKTCDIIIFGGHGDLALRKLMPALYHLFHDGYISQKSRIISVSRDEYSHEEHISLMEEKLKLNLKDNCFDEIFFNSFKEHLYYVKTNLTDSSSYTGLAQLVSECPDNERINYLSTSPALFGKICKSLNDLSLINEKSRVVLEKPIGRDLASSHVINKEVARHFDESAIFRIDHYLGKDTVQNILALRFSNMLFAPIWNAQYIDHIQITIAESIGLEGRWDYYNEYGLGGIYPSVASNGNLYFCHATNRPPSLFMSRYENGNYSLPEELDGALNEFDGAHPYIAPDESYIIFDNEDLFISFRDKNGLWMKPQNLGKSVNTVYDERRPFVSFDGKYLFFASNRINPELPNEPITLKKLQQLINLQTNGFRHLYWVDAKIIDEFRPDNFK